MTAAVGRPVGRGPLVALDARIKIVVAVALILGCVSAPARPAPLLAYLALVLALLAAAAVPPRWLLPRLGAAAVLTLLVAAGSLVGGPGGPDRGRLGLLVGRAAVGIGAVSWLLATTGLPRLLRGLERLRLPPQAADLLALTHRYGLLLAGEAAATHRALLARGGGGGRWLRHVPTTGRLAGALYLRSTARAERVHAAMLARGLDEQRPGPPPRRPSGRELAGGLLLFGLALAPRVLL